jgi:hypothetical protein
MVSLLSWLMHDRYNYKKHDFRRLLNATKGQNRDKSPTEDDRHCRLVRTVELLKGGGTVGLLLEKPDQQPLCTEL